jgi:sporulation protein YlmC with PRC-barrel domain
MRIDLGAKVRTKDGHGAGHVKKVVWDPRANRIIAYVINTGGLLGHEVVISPEVLEAAAREGDELVINLTKKELGDLARYEEAEYTAPPPDWTAPDFHALPTAGYLWPIGYMDVAPSIVPPRHPQEDHEEHQERGHSPQIREGMRVRDANGDEIGVVAEIRVDEATEELRAIVVRRGGALDRIAGGGATLEIDAEQIGHVDHDELRLVTSGAEILGRQRA